jgi:hypothetical protein
LALCTPPRKEVVIGNNSALFATAASLMAHAQKAPPQNHHPDLHIIKPSHWLDNVLPEYFDSTWGQTMYGLPKFARDILHLAHPEHPPTKLITLGQFITLREVVINILKSGYNVPIYEGTPTIENSPNELFKLKIIDQNKNIQILFDEAAYYYNWYRIPRLHNLADKAMPNRSAALLYSQPREAAHDVLIILGAGLQTAWAERNFRKSRIICLRNPGDEIPRLPANAEVNYSRIEYVNINTCKIETLNSSGAIQLTSSELREKTIRGEFYEGIGYKAGISFKGFLPNTSHQFIDFEFDLRRLVTNSRQTVEAYRVTYTPPPITQEMKLIHKQSIDSAKVVRELTKAEYDRIDEVLTESKSATNIY